jgi:hypothetical protein
MPSLGLPGFDFAALRSTLYMMVFTVTLRLIGNTPSPNQQIIPQPTKEG